MRLLALVSLAGLLIGCSKTSPLDALNTREITLPGRHIIRAETAVDTRDVLRGLAFRDSLAADHGLLYVHAKTGYYGYWMYQVNFPLDMIWMDDSHTIVDLVENAPPCKTAASKCPHYGGLHPARYVLEINAGLIHKYGLHLGQTITW